MLSTAKVIVRSPANAVAAVITDAIRARALKYLFIGQVSFLGSGAKQHRGGVVEGERGDHERGRDPEREPDKAVGDRARAGGVLSAGSARLPIDEVKAVTENARRGGDEERLVGSERRQIADPGAADAEGEQDQRTDAAGRCGERAENAASGDQTLPSGLARLRDWQVCQGRFSRGSRSRCNHVRSLFPCQNLKCAVACSL